MTEREQLEQAIAAQEALRATLGDQGVDAVVAVLREKLDALSLHAASEQRKLVTILFADTVASTAMSQHLDPEDVLEIMDGALRLYTDLVGEPFQLLGVPIPVFEFAQRHRGREASHAVNPTLGARSTTISTPSMI